ncbi:MAG: sugar transferase [Anaerolineae bacterium]|nr:sugar transferase [Anaerolineae bacterium]
MTEHITGDPVVDKPASTALDTQPVRSGLQFQPRVRAGIQLQISERRLLLMLGDAVATVCAVFIGLMVWSVVAREPFNAAFVLSRAAWFAVLPPMWFFLASANDFYNLRVTARRGQSMIRLLFIEMQLVVVYLIIFFLAGRDELPRLFILYYAILSFVLIALWRLTRPYLIGWTASRRRALVVGDGPTADSIQQAIAEEAADDYLVVGVIGSSEDHGAPRSQLGTGRDLPRLVKSKNISELIIAYDSTLPADVFQGILGCYEQGVAIVPMPILYEQITGRVPIEHVGQAHWAVVLPLEGNSLSLRIYLFLKRLMDMALALAGLACFGLLLIPLAIVMKLDSPGPLFFTQERTGRGGKVFKIVKLRSMIPDAEKHTGPQWATEDDPRITRVGKLLRKSRLDEVPQLINVLRGDMSIVGPRPERPVFVEQLSEQIPFYRTRLLVTPGLTGWAQVRYRYGNTAEDALKKLQYDLYYIRHRSLTLDVLIMFRTLGRVLSMAGT